MASTYRLGSGLGGAFNAVVGGGGNAAEQSGYNEQLRQNLQDQLLRGKVSDQSAEEAAYGRMPADLEKLGVAPGQGAAFTDVTRATGSKANELGQFVKQMLQVSYLKGAQDAASKGDSLTANFRLAAGGEHPVDMTKIEGNTAYDPNIAPDKQTLQTTPYGNADIASKGKTTQPKTFVGGDGVLRIIHPDGTAEAVHDHNGNPVMADDVAKASQVYKEAYGESMNAPPFEDWFSNSWPKLKAAHAQYIPPQAPATTMPKTPTGTSPAAGEAQARKTIDQALQPAPMDPGERKVGSVYKTPKGPLKWMGKGWAPPR